MTQERLATLEQRLHQAEMALRLSNAKLRVSLDVGKLGSWEHDIATGEVTGNALFKANLGLPADATLTYAQWQGMFHPGDLERINQAIAFSLRTKTDFNIECRVIRGDGRIGRVLMRGGHIFVDGKPVRIFGVVQDVTERERVKDEVNRAQRRQAFLLDLNDQLRGMDDPSAIMEATARALALFLKVDCAGYGEVDEDRDIVLVEREWSKGAISNEGRHYPLHDFLPTMAPDLKEGRPLCFGDVQADPRTSDPAIQERFRAMNARAVMAVPLLKNGKLKALLYLNAAEPRNWANEELALVEDVTERTWIAVERARAEAAMRESEEKARLIAETLPAIVWIVGEDYLLTYTNTRWLEFSGLPPEEALGDSWMHFIHPDDVARLLADAPIVREQKLLPYVTEVRYRTQSGSYRWHMLRAAPMHDGQGEFRGWCGASVDIHDLKETELALRRSEAQLRIALRVAKMGVWQWDAASASTTLSDRAAEILGMPSGVSIPRQAYQQFVHPDDRAWVSAAMDKALAEQTALEFEYRIKRSKDGAYIWIIVQGLPVFAEDGAFIGMSGVIQEITDRKVAEERQQLLIRELHHRVKNTLATVQAIVGSTARTASSIDEFYQGFVGRIVSLARTHNLLTDDIWQKASLDELVRTELGPYQDEARNRILIDGPPVELPSEAAVPVGMAIHELTTNAAKHGALSTFGGEVDVKWEMTRDDGAPTLHFSWSERGGPRVTPPTRQGFGSRLLQRVLATQLQADVHMDFREDGLHFRMTMPIPGKPALFDVDVAAS